MISHYFIYHAIQSISITEKIWSIGKGEVASSNVSGNINFVLKKTQESLEKIGPDTWKRCIDHQYDEVIHLMELDGLIAPIGIIIEDEPIIPQTFSDKIKVENVISHEGSQCCQPTNQL